MEGLYFSSLAILQSKVQNNVFNVRVCAVRDWKYIGLGATFKQMEELELKILFACCQVSFKKENICI